MELETVWTGRDGWLLHGHPTRGHLITPSDVPITAPDLNAAHRAVCRMSADATGEAIRRSLTPEWQDLQGVIAAAGFSRPTTHKYLQVLVEQGLAVRQMQQVRGRRGSQMRVTYRQA